MPNPFVETISPFAAGIGTGVTGDAVFNDSVVNEWVIRVLLALVVGGMLNLLVGFVKSEITKHRSK